MRRLDVLATAFVAPGTGQVRNNKRVSTIPPCTKYLEQSCQFQNPLLYTAPTSVATTTSLPSLPNPLVFPPQIVVQQIGFLQFLFAFTLGGLFFSTVLAAITAVAAVGLENVSQLWSITQIVSVRVWQVFCLGLGETRKALRMDGKWKWREAWRVLKEKLLETRKAVGEGVEAIRMEASMFSAAVGAPGLIPIQYVVDHLLPYSIQTQMKEAMVDVLRELDNPNIKKAVLDEFSVGQKAPQLMAARVYDLGGNTMAFDVDVVWKSDLDMKINIYTKRLGVKIPVSVKNVSFEGPVRIQLSPLTNEPPGFGAALVSLASIPKISFGVRVAGGEILKVPWLKKEIMKGVQESISETLLWPKRLVIPQQMAMSTRKLLSARQLELLETSDPFLEAEKELLNMPLIRQHRSRLEGDRSTLADLVRVDLQGNDLPYNGNTTVVEGAVSTSNDTAAKSTKKGESSTEKNEHKRQPKLVTPFWQRPNSKKKKPASETA